MSFSGLQDEYGHVVCDKDGEPLIHTDGTGFISEDLAMLCAKDFIEAKGKHDGSFEVNIFTFTLLPLFIYKERVTLHAFRVSVFTTDIFVRLLSFWVFNLVF